ncbi:patatin-like phospholipase family protein [Mesorhizobium kowhaii]|uniref:PNPLA domain-containing protein n=1 Tax=Mesorhizobium kowhaii TaxID=1300272 RepID=A0A2W7C5Y9_9HYPH|nr:patatin-like phospholipase family protein [Mesorhizobium kowhaii]PZV38287.1 hypothetical protein B5V02_11635 [Mesorhizobium kowhaii]
MSGDAETLPISFYDVMIAEASVVSRRRELIAARRAADKKGGKRPPNAPSVAASRAARVHVVTSGTADERGDPYPRIEAERDLTGLACSGGGVRSAAFCMGVLQALESITEEDQPKVFDNVDYLSTVSGGGYIGTSLVAGLMQTDGVFPFTSTLGGPESLETQHIRHYSNYLAPNGFIDVIVGLVVLLRGLLVNAMIFLAALVTLAWLTILINPTEASLRLPIFEKLTRNSQSVFFWSIVLVTAFGLIQIGYSIFAFLPSKRPDRMTTLVERETTSRVFAFVFIVCLLIAFFEFQAYVLAGLFDAANPPKDCKAINWVGCALIHMPNSLSGLWSVLVGMSAGLAAFGNKLIAVVVASKGDNSWTGIARHLASKVLLYCLSVVVPIFLWVVYLSLSYAGISGGDAAAVTGNARENYAIVAGLLIVFSLLVTPNANSLHGYYRDRLSRAFLWRLDKLRDGAKSELVEKKRVLAPLKRWLKDRKARKRETDVDQFKLTSLKPGSPGNWADSIWFSPYLIINTTVNLEGSPYLGRRGRSADAFFLSPLYTGSQATGYVATDSVEQADRNLNIGTAMAISGAAASANMGANTIRALTFSLAALNVRLGYWLPNPRFVGDRSGLRRWLAHVAPWYFAKEALGKVDELTSNVYLTDGGHFDNLGLYELLKRRCKVIVVADAEADPTLDFNSLIRVERYARIDLGILIDLPWAELRRSNAQATEEKLNDSPTDEEPFHGPHVAIGRIDYGEDEHGVLIYIKSCMSGDESDMIRDYRRRYPQFPHQTTLDQFFNEEQFEVYRALGFHATRNFFIGKDRFAGLKSCPMQDWPSIVRRALAQLNVPQDAVEKIVQRQQDTMI